MSREPAIVELSRRDFQGPPVRVLKRGCNYAADLLVYRVRGEEVVLKDYSARAWVWRNLVGRLLTWREARVLQILVGLRGVPQFRGRPDRCSVAMTHIPSGKTRKSDPLLKGNEEFMHELEGIVRRMHGRGVVHLDLRHHSNLRVTPDGHPVVLDFASGFCFNQSWFGGRLAVRLFGWVDRLAVLKWKRRLCPHMLTQREKRRLRLGRKLGMLLLPRKFLRALLHLLRKEE